MMRLAQLLCVWMAAQSCAGALILHFSFADAFTNAGYVTDQSGHGNHGWQFNLTNWITPTNTAIGAGAFFVTNKMGFVTNGATMNDCTDNGQNYPGMDTNNCHWYPGGQYLAVTNQTDLTNMPAGTVSFWALFNDKYVQTISRILDCMGSEAGSNSWYIGRRPTAQTLSFRGHAAATLDSDGTVLVNWPTDGNDNGGNTNMTHYAVTWDKTSNTAIAYRNGLPVATNTTGLAIFATLGLNSVKPWLCVGASMHGTGTPQWGDDRYPNDNYFNGVLDEIRIYDSALAPASILELYDNPTGPTSGQTLTITGSLNVGTITNAP